MKSFNKFGLSSFFPSFLAAALLFSLSILGMSCGGGGDNNNNNNGGGAQPSPIASTAPAVDPTLAAQTFFSEKIWPSFQNARCSNCHDFDAQRFNIYPSHPVGPLTDGDTAKCNGCHINLVMPSYSGWVQAPVADKWNPASDPKAIRAHIIAPGVVPNLYNHLVGEGVDKTPLVQWAFFNGPDGPMGTNQIHAGKVPMGGTHHPSGQITLDATEMLDWNAFKPAVNDWLCLEAKAGNTNLGLPPAIVCP